MLSPRGQRAPGPRRPGHRHGRTAPPLLAASRALRRTAAPWSAGPPVRLLGEDLVLFRDDAGRPGLLGLICSHRGANLSYGRLEDGGLRCIYHGWLYDIHGNCLEQPGEPVGSTFYERIRHKAYPCQETAGVIFAYLGPGEPPLVPAYEVLDGPAALRSVTKIYRECNYLQANEGNLDSVHLSFLHSRVRAPGETGPREGSGDGPFDVIDPEETDYGLRVYWVRNTSPDRYFLHVTNFVLSQPVLAGGTRGDWTGLPRQLACPHRRRPPLGVRDGARPQR